MESIVKGAVLLVAVGVQHLKLTAQSPRRLGTAQSRS